MGAIDAILFDLDDTLLGNDMDVFLQGYFPLLAAYAKPVIDPDRFLPELMHATQAMIHSDNLDLTNREVFWQVFCERNELKQEEVEPFFATFYQEHFSQMQPFTECRPEAAPLVRWCMDQGLKVVVATNPLFPLDAIEQRLSWAGLAVDDFDFELITGYENMHAAKPRSAYYREILAEVDVAAGRALMVGDDWQNDIAPAAKMGLYTYWIEPEDGATSDDQTRADGQGQLRDLSLKLRRGWLQE